jgi:hypothetical protein
LQPLSITSTARWVYFFFFIDSVFKRRSVMVKSLRSAQQVSSSSQDVHLL